MPIAPLPAFELEDECGAVFRSSDMEGLRWVLAVVRGEDEEPLSLLEARNVRTLMMNAPMVVISDLGKDAISSLRSRLSSRLQLLSDPNNDVIPLIGSVSGGSPMMVVDKRGDIVSAFGGIDARNLDRAVKRLSRL